MQHEYCVYAEQDADGSEFNEWQRQRDAKNSFKSQEHQFYLLFLSLSSFLIHFLMRLHEIQTRSSHPTIRRSYNVVTSAIRASEAHRLIV